MKYLLIILAAIQLSGCLVVVPVKVHGVYKQSAPVHHRPPPPIYRPRRF